MTIRYNGHPVIGFGQPALVVPTAAAVASTSPWTIALATTFLSSATGWAIEEVARRTIRKGRL